MSESLSVEQVDPEELRRNPKNPRVHPDSSLEKLEKSIEEYGWTNPVIANEEGMILAGHARVKTARKMGLDEVPVIRVDLEGEEAEGYMIADNRTQSETEWEQEGLEDLMRELDQEDFDLELTGFDQDEIEELLGEEDEEDEVEGEKEFSEELMEEHQYVVLYFDNSMDWQVAQEIFDIETVKGLDDSENYTREGVGRVIRGDQVLEMLGETH